MKVIHSDCKGMEQKQKEVQTTFPNLIDNQGSFVQNETINDSIMETENEVTFNGQSADERILKWVIKSGKLPPDLKAVFDSMIMGRMHNISESSGFESNPSGMLTIIEN